MDRVAEVISTGNIEVIFALYKNSLVSRQGQQIRNLINSEVNYIAKINGYDPIFYSFKKFILYHDDVTSPLRLLPISSNWIVLPYDCKVPYTLEDFIYLLKRTTLNGLRTVMTTEVIENVDFCSDYGFVITQNGKIRSFPRESYRNFLTFSTKHHMTRDVSSYFDPNSEFNPTTFFLDGTPICLFKLMIEAIDRGYSNVVYFPALTKSGEYQTYIRDYNEEMPLFHIFLNDDCLLRGKTLIYAPEENPFIQMINTFLYGVEYNSVTYSQLTNDEERASYLAFVSQPNWDTLKRRYKHIARVFGLYTGYTKFNSLQGQMYTCINTGMKMLCLVTQTQYVHSNQFILHKSRYQGGLWLHTISLK